MHARNDTKTKVDCVKRLTQKEWEEEAKSATCLQEIATKYSVSTYIIRKHMPTHFVELKFGINHKDIVRSVIKSGQVVTEAAATQLGLNMATLIRYLNRLPQEEAKVDSSLLGSQSLFKHTNGISRKRCTKRDSLALRAEEVPPKVTRHNPESALGSDIFSALNTLATVCTSQSEPRDDTKSENCVVLRT